MKNISKTIYCDVAVIGGGVGGCAAAIEAARKGMRTILFEKGVTLGGLAASIAVNERVAPRAIKGERIRSLLIEEGVELDKPCDGHWAELREMDCDLVINAGDAITCVEKK